MLSRWIKAAKDRPIVSYHVPSSLHDCSMFSANRYSMPQSNMERAKELGVETNPVLGLSPVLK